MKNCLLVFIGPILIGVLGLAILILVQVTGIPAGTILDTDYIRGVSSHSGIEGSFFLGSGTVETKQYYYYYAERQGGLVMQKVLAENSVIYETDNEIPRVEKVQRNKEGINPTYKIYVPSGTISHIFELQLPGQ